MNFLVPVPDDGYAVTAILRLHRGASMSLLRVQAVSPCEAVESIRHFEQLITYSPNLRHLDRVEAG